MSKQLLQTCRIGTPRLRRPRSARLEPCFPQILHRYRRSDYYCAPSVRRDAHTMSLPRSFPMRLAGGKTTEAPSIGFGTWASDGKSPTSPAHPTWIAEPLKVAFEVGYRHLDCAWFYGVDREIAEAIRVNNIARSDVFIVSKIWTNFYHPDKVELCCDKILEGMQTDYVDCLLLHWPTAFEPTSLDALNDATASNQATLEQKAIKQTKDGGILIDWKHTSEPIAWAAGKEGSIVPTWNVMKSLVKKGKARAIGVSNFGIADLKALLPHAQDIPISMNQIECHPWFPQREMIEFHKQHGIITSCFSPFAGQKADGKTLIQDPTVKELAKKNDMDVGQLLQSWAVQRGTIPLGKSGNKNRIRTNFSVRRLSDEDMKALDDLEVPDGRGRSIDFTDEWGVQLYQS